MTLFIQIVFLLDLYYYYYYYYFLNVAPNTYNESETLTKFEIMDGSPVKGESIPVRLFLGHFDLTPTYRNVHSKFSVKYFLNLVLVDEEDRRYFKQQEITLWRRPPKKFAGHVIPPQLEDVKKKEAEAKKVEEEEEEEKKKEEEIAEEEK